MPLRFQNSHKPEAYQVLQHFVGAPLHLVGGSDRSFELTHALHWLPAQKRTVPCGHEDCAWCPIITRDVTYVPVLAWHGGERCWKQKVLAVTDKMFDWLEMPRAGVIWIFERHGRFNAPVEWKKSERLPNPQPFAGFPLLPSLLRMWGMYAQFKRTIGDPTKAITLFPGERGEDVGAG